MTTSCGACCLSCIRQDVGQPLTVEWHKDITAIKTVRHGSVSAKLDEVPTYTSVCLSPGVPRLLLFLYAPRFKFLVTFLTYTLE
jgi:hypothetical protein